MPIISRYHCGTCDFELPSGLGGYTYAVDDHGRRVVCAHPREGSAVREVTGLDYGAARDAGRAGYAKYCVCLECLKQFDLDFDRDVVVCPACASVRVRSVRQLVGQPCPQCTTGRIEEESSFKRPLDPDWEQLPVPQIVKDLVQFGEERKVSGTLERAAEIANRLGKYNFVVLTNRLLDWWEGPFFSKNPVHDSAQMQSQWSWCQALPQVLAATPELAVLIVVGDGRCRFSVDVSPDLRRGIRNYVRKHRMHNLMT